MLGRLPQTSANADTRGASRATTGWRFSAAIRPLQFLKEASRSSLRRWIEHLLISSPLLGDFLQKLILVDETFLDEQLRQRVGLREAGDKKFL